MHTLIRLDEGVLEISLHSAGDRVQEGKWRAAIAPAILLLRHLGGGALLVPHRPDDLVG